MFFKVRVPKTNRKLECKVLPNLPPQHSTKQNNYHKKKDHLNFPNMFHKNLQNPPRHFSNLLLFGLGILGQVMPLAKLRLLDALVTHTAL